MASYYSNKRGGWQLRADVTAAQNTAGNYSDVTVKVYLVADSGWNIVSSAMSGTTNINGSSAGFSFNPSTNGGTTALLTTRTVKVPHNADGTKTVGISFSYNLAITSSNLGGTVGNLSGSGTMTLPKIPRAFDFIMSSTTANIGDNLTIKVIDTGSGFKPWGSLHFGSAKIDLKEMPVGTNKSFLLDPAILGSQIPNSAKGTGGFYLDTWQSNASGAPLIGQVSHRIDLTMPASVGAPSISSVAAAEGAEKVKTLLGTGNNYLQGQSNIIFTVTSAAKYGASISKTEVLYKGTSIPIVNGKPTLNLANIDVTAGEQTATAKVTDSRGFSVTKDIKFTVLAYNPPIISMFNAMRNTKDMTTIDVAKTGTVASVKVGTAEKNTYTAKTEYRLINAETWTNAKSETNAFANVAILKTDIKKSYEIQVTLTDQFSTVTSIVTVSTGKYPLTYYRDEGVGVVKVYEPGHGALDVGGDIWQNGRSLLDTFYPIGSVYQSVNSANPSTFMGGTWERIAKGQVLVGVNENDTDFSTAGKTGGQKTQGLIARIGGTSKSGQLTMRAVDPESGGLPRNYGLANLTNTAIADFGTQKYSTVVTRSDGTDSNTLQPYIAVYIWKRTA